MSANRGTLLTVALFLAALNVAGGIYASLTAEPMHAFVHGAFAFGFGLWAWNLKRTPAPPATRLPEPDRADLLAENLTDLERELRDTQERLQFTEELLRNKKPPGDGSATGQ